MYNIIVYIKKKKVKCIKCYAPKNTFNTKEEEDVDVVKWSWKQLYISLVFEIKSNRLYISGFNVIICHHKFIDNKKGRKIIEKNNMGGYKLKPMQIL